MALYVWDIVFPSVIVIQWSLPMVICRHGCFSKWRKTSSDDLGLISSVSVDRVLTARQWTISIDFTLMWNMAQITRAWTPTTSLSEKHGEFAWQEEKESTLTLSFLVARFSVGILHRSSVSTPLQMILKCYLIVARWPWLFNYVYSYIMVVASSGCCRSRFSDWLYYFGQLCWLVEDESDRSRRTSSSRSPA